MQSRKSKKLLEILDHALTLPPEERQSFVERICAGDQQLQARVLKLLAEDRTNIGSGEGDDSMPEISESRHFSSRYDLKEEIARGGGGRILKAFDRELGRHVAIKVLHEKFNDNPRIVRRFVTEAQISACLTHPGMVPVYEIGRLENGEVFIAMKLVEGETFVSLLSGSHRDFQSQARSIEIFQKVCHVVAYAHSKNVIHRDLKPDNIIVSSFGEVLVMDWGIAKTLNGNGSNGPQTVTAELPKSPASETRIGAAMGTPAYMPPEQIVGLSQLQSDVFALGGILCEILTGYPPYGGLSSTVHLSKASKVEIGEAILRLRQSDADAVLVELSVECLDPNPENRPSNAGVVAARVDHHIRGVEERLREAEIARENASAVAAEQIKRFRLRNAALFVTVVLVISVSAFVVHNSRKNTEYAEKIAAVERAERIKATASGYWATMTSGYREFAGGNRNRADLLLDSSPVSSRNWEWYYLHHRLRSSTWEHVVVEANVRFTAYSQSENSISLIADDGAVTVVDVGTRKTEKRIATQTGEPLCVSEDGVLVLSAMPAEDADVPLLSNRLVLWDVRTGEIIQDFGPILLSRHISVAHCSISPNGEYISCSAPGGNINVHAVRTGNLVKTLETPGVTSITFSRDSSCAIYSNGDQIRFYHMAEGTDQRPAIPHEPNDAYALLLSPDGSFLAMLGKRETTVWNLKTESSVSLAIRRSDVIRPTTGFTAPKTVRAAFTPSGEEMVTIDGQGTFAVWNVHTGKRIHQHEVLGGVFGRFGPYSWIGEQIIVPLRNETHSSILVSDVAPRDPNVFEGHSSYVYPVAISGDGATVVSGSWDNTLRVWDAQTREIRLICRGHDYQIFDMALDSKNARFVSVDLTSHVRMWDLSSGTQQAHRAFPTGVFTEGTTDYSFHKRVAFSPNGSQVLFAGDSSLFVLDAENLQTMSNHPYSSLVEIHWLVIDMKISKSGDWVGIVLEQDSGRSIVRIFDLATFEVRATILPDDSVTNFEFSPDESHIAVAYADGRVELWSLSDTTTPIWREKNHAAEVFALQFTPDGSRLFSGGREGTISIWDTGTGKPFGPLTGHKDYIYSLDISEDGTRLVSGSGDGTVRIWEAPSFNVGDTKTPKTF